MEIFSIFLKTSLRNINALQLGFELWDESGDLVTSPLRLQVTGLPRDVLDQGDDLLVTLGLSLPSTLTQTPVLVSIKENLRKPTAGWSTELPGLLGAAGDGGVLLHVLLGDAAHLPRPLGALGVGGVAGGLVLALLLHLSPALHHVVLHVVHLLLGPALGLVLGAADLGTLHVAVLHQRGAADLDGLVEGDLLVLDEASLPEVLLAVLLLLGLVVGGVGGVAPPVVRVVALHHIVILSLLHHLHLVNAPLAVSTRASSSDSGEADISITALAVGTASQVRGGGGSMVVFMVLMVVITALLVEGEGASEGALVPRLTVASQPTSSQGRGDHKEGKEELGKVWS